MSDCWVSGIIMVYAALFGTGKWLLGEPILGVSMIAVAIAAGVALSMAMQPATAREEVLA